MDVSCSSGSGTLQVKGWTSVTSGVSLINQSDGERHNEVLLCPSHRTFCRGLYVVRPVSENSYSSFEKCFLQQEQMGGETAAEEERNPSNDDSLCFIAQ